MDSYGTLRLAAKNSESAIITRICEDFNLTPVLARAYYEQMAKYFAEYGQGSDVSRGGHGQVNCQ